MYIYFFVANIHLENPIHIMRLFKFHFRFELFFLFQNTAGRYNKYKIVVLSYGYIELLKTLLNKRGNFRKEHIIEGVKYRCSEKIFWNELKLRF